ncbi:osmoprotectant transport system substrate-binding protein [Kineosphaera limosa]|uniref:Putative ABC transporter substrate-binding protein n=1 Tax=Kineosphaera limosa NBRC 100340 TaxID=1184609 RepID=K6X5M0_9MICO|nr:ABC transporter substrate-binding protein [Kineosphaera limosa]NYE02244.1 osmoprotectant transport system substrate-binding protein [Kineosphaera limosa]GAB94099.1 putative ABC transporter substrate-binding protein [Kineosphaera limosa NBRC 100340]
MIRRTTLTAATLATLLATAACGGTNGTPLDQPTDGAPAATAAAGSITVGSANFPESELLMNIYAGALQAKGVNVTTRPNIGSRETYIPALKDGSINLVPEYTGVLMQYFDQSATATAPDEVYAALQQHVPDGLKVLAKAEAEDKDSVVVTRETATQHNLKTIADLAPVAGDMVLGGPPEWRTRETGVPGLKRVYDLTFKEFRPLDTAGPLTVQALKNGQVQAANLFTTDPNVAANDFVALEDPKSLFAAQNIVPLIAADAATDQVTQTLDAVSAALTTENLAAAVKEVVIDRKDSAAVADAFLTTHELK